MSRFALPSCLLATGCAATQQADAVAAGAPGFWLGMRLLVMRLLLSSTTLPSRLPGPLCAVC